MINICFPFVGDSFGGSHKSALLLINNLNKKKYKIKIVLHKKGILSHYLERHKIIYDTLNLNTLAGENPNKIITFKHMIKNFIKIQKYIKDNDIHIVHSNDLRCNLSWSLPSKMNASHIWHQRTLISDSFIWKYTYLLTNRIVSISKTVRKKIYGNSDLIYNPFIEIKLNKKESQCNLRLELKFNNNPIVGYVGRLEKDKGIEMFHKISKKMREVNFVVYGDGKVNINFPKNVRIVKFTDDIEKKIEGLDLLISTSLKEGFGRTLVEAMLVKTPVIATKIDAHREISSEENFISLVEINNVKEFIDKINFILTDQSNLSYLEKARKYAVRKFGIDEHVRKIERIYDSLNG
tara:strand:+ start:817 stop:1866 length:1050 start_codon:yes stop_codon:yes gene_type:complete